MNSRVFGLDIGTTLIKCALVKRDGNLFSLESIAAVPSTPRGLTSESLIDLEALADAVRKMLSDANLKSTNVAFCIPENQIYTKVIEMPQLSEQELAAALKFEMEQYIPLPLDQVKTDWVVLERSEVAEKKTMDVMIVAAPISIVQKYEKLSEMLNLKPETVEGEVVSVHRALLPIVSTSVHLILHIGASASSICIAKRGAIKTVVSLPTGGAAITRAISLDLGIDQAQAESHKRAYGLSQEALGGSVGKAVSPILESIAVDVKKAMLSFREKNTDEAVSQVVLSGGTSLLPGIGDFFAKDLNTQVVLGSCFAAYNMANVPQELLPQAPTFNAVVGLSLRNLL